MCEAYDIIEWKSCATLSSRSTTSSTDNQKETNFNLGGYTLSRDGICSTNDIVFPKLFKDEDDPDSEQSGIISMADMDYYGRGPYDYLKEKPPDEFEEQSVYQKVSSWVLSQRKYFLNNEPLPIEDDEMEVIDPVDLFHESILNEYFLITEDDCERRAVFRELKSNHYEIESIEAAMETFDYKFLRQPKKNIEMELMPLIHFHHQYGDTNTKRKRKRKTSSSTISTVSTNWEIEREEETIDFLGVPRLLENYVIFNREGRAIIPDAETDLWLSPLQEDLRSEESTKGVVEHEEIEFLSSWFSDAYHDIHTDENRTLITDKVTVISSVSHCTGEEVWVDAPEIPHWLEGEEEEELELFNQPSRPLYYYRDRIKGCYRIIGVEDETVVLFSGNDDDTIFYNEDDDDFQITKTFPEPRVTRNIFREFSVERTRQVVPRRRNRSNSADRKNDSGIEDIDDMIGEEVALASLSLSDKEAKELGYETYQVRNNDLSSRERRIQSSETLLDWILVALFGFIIVVFVFVFCVKDLDKATKKFNLKAIKKFYHDIEGLFYRLKTRINF